LDEVFGIGRRLYSVAEKEVAPKSVLVVQRRTVDGWTYPVLFKKCSEGVAASGSEGNVAVSAESEIGEAVLNEVFGGEAPDCVRVGLYRGKPWFGRCAEAVDDRTSAIG
jgi:hypothetical protein